MANNARWSDEYWLPLIQLYLRKPVGVKPLYDRGAIDLCLELHLPPELLHKQLQRLRLLDNPRIERLWERYSTHPRQLAAAVEKWRRMRGFGFADMFYEGVERKQLDVERLFRPIDEDPQWKPFMLIIVLGLYFRLTPLTMVAETPEVQQLAKKMRVKADDVVNVLRLYRQCDPLLHAIPIRDAALFAPCEEIWQRYEALPDGQLEADATQMMAYFE